MIFIYSPNRTYDYELPVRVAMTGTYSNEFLRVPPGLEEIDARCNTSPDDVIGRERRVHRLRIDTFWVLELGFPQHDSTKFIMGPLVDQLKRLHAINHLYMAVVAQYRWKLQDPKI